MLGFKRFSALRAILYPLERTPGRSILMRMDRSDQMNSPESDVEYVKGCPVCEHSDPQLERELQEFAQWLFEIILADQKSKCEAQQQPDVDKNF